MSAESGHPLFRFSRRNRPRDGRKIRRRPVFSRSVRRFCGRRTGYAYGRCEPPGLRPTGYSRRANEEKPSSPAFAGSVRPVVILRRTVPVVRVGAPPRFPASCTPDRFRTGPKERNPTDIKKGVETGKANAPRTTPHSRHPEPFSETPRNMEQCPACVGHFFHAFPPG